MILLNVTPCFVDLYYSSNYDRQKDYWRVIMAKHIRPNNKAFSILQLLVVISILVALATVAIPQAAL
jgi:type II secretory pathway pseudopilin PulG